MPLADLVMSLEQALPGVALDRPGYQPRQRLSAVFSHAIDNLAPTDRNALARLTGFTAPFTLLSAGRLAAAPLAGVEIDAPVVASLVRLAEAGLIQVLPGEPQRYALTPLQTAAASRLVTESQSAAIRAAVEDWYVSFAREQGRRLRCPEQLDALHLIDAEFSNVLSVAHALLTAGRAREVLAITGGLGDYWRIGRNQLAGVQLLLAALEADSGGDSIERLQALVTLPFAASTFAGIARQAGRSRDATAMAVRLGRRDLADEALLAVGLAEAWAGRHPDGYETLGRVATSEANPWAAGTAQLIRSLMLIIVGRADDARRGVERVARELRIAGDRIGEATAFMHLAVGLQRHGEADDAEAAADRGLELAGGDIPLVTMHSNYVLGLIGDERGDRAGAELLEEVQRHFRHVGDLGCLNGVNRALADIARRRGDDEGALELLREVVWLLPDVDHQETAASLVQIAEVYLAQGHCDDAVILAMAAKRLVGGSGIGWNDRQHQRLAAVLDAAPVAPESPEHPLAHVIGVALQA